MTYHSKLEILLELLRHVTVAMYGFVVYEFIESIIPALQRLFRSWSLGFFPLFERRRSIWWRLK